MSSRTLGMVIVALVAGTAGTAWAGLQSNGVQLNGVQLNGVQLNGVQLNGVQLNGVQLNGVQLNGVQLNGVQLNGSLLNGSIIGSSSSCTHREDRTGTKLPYACSPCAQMVQTADSYCSQYYWDSICVSEARSMCAVDSRDMVGGTFSMNAVAADGTVTTYTARIDGVSLAPGSSDVWLHQVSYYVPAHYTFRCTRLLGCTAVWVAASWKGICPSYDNDGLYNRAIVAKGAWESRTGTGFVSSYNGATYSGGGRIPGSETATFSFACRDSGAIAKCTERFGYKYWMSNRSVWAYGYVNGTYTSKYVSVPVDTMMQACVREVRADYCGDGMAHTVNGTPIDAWDNGGIQSMTSSLVGYGFEGSWRPGGAKFLGEYRYYDADPNPAATWGTVSNYISTYCAGDVIPGMTGQGVTGMDLLDSTGNAPQAVTSTRAQWN